MSTTTTAHGYYSTFAQEGHHTLLKKTARSGASATVKSTRKSGRECCPTPLRYRNKERGKESTTKTILDYSSSLALTLDSAKFLLGYDRNKLTLRGKVSSPPTRLWCSRQWRVRGEWQSSILYTTLPNAELESTPPSLWQPKSQCRSGHNSVHHIRPLGQSNACPCNWSWSRSLNSNNTKLMKKVPNIVKLFTNHSLSHEGVET